MTELNTLKYEDWETLYARVNARCEQTLARARELAEMEDFGEDMAKTKTVFHRLAGLRNDIFYVLDEWEKSRKPTEYGMEVLHRLISHVDNMTVPEYLLEGLPNE